MKWNRDDEIPIGGGETWFCGGDEEVGEERFEPGGVVVFVAMDRFLYDAGKLRGGTGGAKVDFLVATVEAFERDGDIARKRKSAAFAEGWLDPFDPSFAGAAGVADITLGAGRALFATHLADFRIEEREEVLSEAAETGEGKGRVHCAMILGRGGTVFCTRAKVTMSTRVAAQPSMILFVPQNQVAA